MAELVGKFSYFVTEINVRKVVGEVSKRTQEWFSLAFNYERNMMAQRGPKLVQKCKK